MNKETMLRNDRKLGNSPKFSMFIFRFIVVVNTNQTKRENPIVIRGSKAIGIVYNMTGRIPALIQQSHLERNEGEFQPTIEFVMGGLLTPS
jgi:hypothetical protein